MPPANAKRRLNTLAWTLAGVYALDRLLKLWAASLFLHRPEPPAPHHWPSVTLLQPITRGASDLRGALACRAALRYGKRLQHILICDAGDAETWAVCQAWQTAHPELEIQIAGVQGGAGTSRGRTATSRGWDGGQAADSIATKVEKLIAGLRYARGEVLAFVDDDILLRPDCVEQLVRHLQQPGAGSVFGLAVYTNWRNAASSLLSAFVNGNALLSYLPLTYLAKPFTITGHFYALRRELFEAIGGLEGMEGRFDDDHELARRVQRYGLLNVQTPALYDVDNHLVTLYDYANQMQRWFVIPKLTMVPYLSARQQVVSVLGSAGNLILPALGLLVLAGRAPLAPLLWSLTIFSAVYAWCERRSLRCRTPWLRWPLLWLSALIAPLQALAALLHGSTFTWRGQRIRLEKGGQFSVTTYGTPPSQSPPRSPA